MNNKNALVFIFYNKHERKFLLEKRLTDQFLAGEKIFPGGRIENDELNDYSKTLKRECLEEFKIIPKEYYIFENPVIGESGYKLWPCLILKWQGKIPRKVKDKGSAIEWVTINGYKSSIKSQNDIYKNFIIYIMSHNIDR